MTSTIGKLFNRAPVAYVPRTDGVGSRFAGTRTDMTTQLEQMEGISTLYSIVNRTSNALSQVDWHLYRVRSDARRKTPMPDDLPRVEVTSHAALTVWNKPNNFMSGMFFREACQQHQDLVGETDILVVRDPIMDIPMELWPVRPDRMTPIPHPTEYLTGWIYTGPNGEKVPLDVRDVIQIKLPNPKDPYRGLGPVQALLSHLDSAKYSAEWNRNFFLNSAEPGGMVEFEDELDDAEFEKFQKRWRDSHQGVNNAHRVAVLENGLKWKDRSYSQRDMQFAELANLSREIIREGFGIHSHMLGLTEDVNRANADAGEVSFARWLTSPRAARWEDMLNTTYLPMFGDTGKGVEFEHDRVVPEDREADDRERTSKANAAAALAHPGVWDPVDILRAVGLPEMAVIPVDQRQPAKPPVPAVPGAPAA